jgi:hypothetical protein
MARNTSFRKFIDVVCFDLNVEFTAELAESAEEVFFILPGDVSLLAGLN